MADGQHAQVRQEFLVSPERPKGPDDGASVLDAEHGKLLIHAWPTAKVWRRMRPPREGEGVSDETFIERHQRLARDWEARMLAIADAFSLGVPRCPSLSPESEQRCWLPDHPEMHRLGHESALVRSARVSWATRPEDQRRWEAA